MVPGVQLNARIAQVRQRIAADEQRIAKLTKSGGDEAQVELVQAQLALDQDDLEDAQQDLIRQGGDERTRLQRARQEHADAQKEPAQAAKPASIGEGSTLAWQVQAWLALGVPEKGVTVPSPT